MAVACIALSDDSGVQALNSTYRGQNKPTNVLSFPARASDVRAEPASDVQAEPAADMRAESAAPRLLGDVVLAAETVRREAQEQSVAPRDHMIHLAVHGLLHLMGYDHEDDREAALMEGAEVRILARLGIADPYGERDCATPPPFRD